MARRLTATRRMLVGENTAHRGDDVTELLTTCDPAGLYWLFERGWVDEWDDGVEEATPLSPADLACPVCARPNRNEQAKNIHMGKAHPVEYRALKRERKAAVA